MPRLIIRPLLTGTTNDYLLCARHHANVLHVWMKSYYHSHCTAKETEAQQGEVPCLGLTDKL